MAKFGENDPRWIVNERADGANVNAWHWSESDKKSWADKRLSEMFTGNKLIESGEGNITIEKMKSCEGECYINNRKGRLILVYELNVKLEWSGVIKDGEGNSIVTAKGNVDMPYISEENDLDDFDINVSADGETDGSYRLKELLRKSGSPKIRSIIVGFLKELQSNTEASRASESKPKDKPKVAKEALDKPVDAPAAKPVATDSSGTVKLTSDFRCRPEDVCDALLDPRRVSAYTQCAADIKPEAGAAFKIFDGLIVGTIEGYEPGKKILMKWRINSWPAGVMSTVDITFEEPESSITRLKLVQTGVPRNEVQSTEEGWRQRFFERIKMAFGYSTSSPF